MLKKYFFYLTKFIAKSPTTHKTQPLSIITNSQPFSYHASPSTLNRNLTKSSTDIRPSTRLSNRERRNSLERNEIPIRSPTTIPSTYKSSPSQRAYYSSIFSPINNYESNNEPSLNSPLLPITSNQLLNPINQQPQRYRTRIISTETTTESTTSTTVKPRPQDSLINNNNIMDKSGGTIRYHNINLEPIDR